VRFWERILFNLSTLAVSVTGILYFWMKYLLETDDPFSLVNHPWQIRMMDLHILSSPVLLLVVGIIFESHIASNLRNGKYFGNRRSGVAVLLTFPVMVFSGYLLQVFSDPWLLRISLYLHLGTGGLFAMSYLVHQVISVRIRIRQVCGNQKDSLVAEV